MLNGLVHAHSGLRWIVLILLLSAVFKTLLKWRSAAPYTDGDRKLYFFTMLVAHFQLILGLVLFFQSEKVSFSDTTMSNQIFRFFTVEHSLIMILAIILITLGYTRSKKALEESQKYRLAFWYFLSALILILAGIPWPFRGLGTGWF